MKTTGNIRSILILGMALLSLVSYQFISAQVNPTGTPPSGNVPAPINVGASSQTKEGNLFSSSSMAANVVAAFTEMRSDRYCDANGENCFFGNDSSTSTDNIIIGGKCFKPANLVTCNWNWNGSGNDDATYVIPIDQNPTACGGTNRTYRRHDVILAECESTYFRWQESGMTCNAPYANQCQRTYGTMVQTVQCVNGPGQVVPDSNCASAGPKPPTTGASCSRWGGGGGSNGC